MLIMRYSSVTRILYHKFQHLCRCYFYTIF
ncbi:hypothetical protein CS5676_0043 [Clostridium phage phiCs5676-1]|nr:hypothetical protein CS5676_0043 [Clostridium phage phiCs5676-1]